MNGAEMLPSPPTIAEEKPMMPRKGHVEIDLAVIKPDDQPANAASPEPIAKVIKTMALKSIPIVLAVSSSCATARMASPSLVRLRSHCRPTITNTPKPSIRTLSSRRLKWPRSTDPFRQ